MYKRAKVTGAALLIAAGISVPSAAAAEEATFTFDAPTTIQAEYGATWQIVGTTSYEFAKEQTTVTSRMSEFPDPAFYWYRDPAYFFSAKLTFLPSQSQPPLTVGTYPLELDLNTIGYGNTPYHANATGATLEIVPASITATAGLAADPTTAGGMIVTGTLSGAYIDQAPQVEYGPNVGIVPAGTWSFVIKDASGQNVFEKSIDDAAGGPGAVSFYWDGAEVGTDYTASALFSVNGALAPNFDITAVEAPPVRSDVAARPIPVADAPAIEQPVQRAAFTIPLWSAILVGVIEVGLAVALTVVLVTSRRRRLRAGDELPVAGNAE